MKNLTKVLDIEEKVKFVTASRSHTIAIDEKGECYSWGCGSYGKLGHRDTADLNKPKQITYFQKPLRGSSVSVI